MLPSIFSTAPEKKTNTATRVLELPALSAILQIEPFRNTNTNRHSKIVKVVSSALFIFPDRVKSAGTGTSEYTQQLQLYLAGLEKGVQCISAFKGWVYRLYVDYSVYIKYEDEKTNRAADMVQKILDRLMKTHPIVFEIYGVRCVGDVQNATFLPSIWRYLPMIDKEVDVFTVIDVDNPVNALLMHLGETWLADTAEGGRKRSNNSMFIAIPQHMSVQCALYIHRYGHPSEHKFCPVAQDWFWKPGTGDTERFVRMMELVADPTLTVFFDVDVEWLYGEFRTAVVTSKGFLDMIDTYKDMAPMKELKNVVRTAVNLISPQTKWSKAVQKSDTLLYMLTMALVGSAADDQENHANHIKGRIQFEAASKVVMNMGYGIDEFVLNALVGPSSKSTIVTADTPEAGLAVQKFNLSVERGAPSPVRLLSAGAIIPDRKVMDYILRTAILCVALQPEKSSSPESFRWFNNSMKPYIDRVRYLHVYKDAVTFLLRNEPAYLRAMLFRLVAVDQAKFRKWCNNIHILYDRNNKLVYQTRDKAEMDAVKDVFVRALFINWFNLHLSQCVSVADIAEFSKIPW